MQCNRAFYHRTSIHVLHLQDSLALIRMPLPAHVFGLSLSATLLFLLVHIPRFVSWSELFYMYYYHDVKETRTSAVFSLTDKPMGGVSQLVYGGKRTVSLVYLCY